MITSLAWLNDYLDRPVDADEADRLLTDLGFPLDGRQAVTTSSGLADEVLDVEITSNRGDCLSHVGQAREIAAASGRGLKVPDCNAPGVAGEWVDALTSVGNDDTALCPLYTARVITGVKVGPSPQWLVDRLEAVGLRSVNNVVDVTNFVLLELGQPLHAFDMAKLAERRIVVREARDGETFTAIDGTKHTLKAPMLVIADAERPVAVAGVMGGLDTEVGDDTTDVLLESAIFEPLSVRTTSRALKLSSDSSFRFERGVDPQGVDRASQRAVKLIIELAGGKLAPGVITMGDELSPPKVVTMRVARCNALLGLRVGPQLMVDYLTRLGLRPVLSKDGTGITCTIPSFRLDLYREVDLIEEIARLHGLEQIDVQEKIHIVARRMQPRVAAEQKLAEVLIAHGFHEAITFNFLSTKQAEAFAPAGEGVVTVEHDRRKAEPALQSSALPSLLNCRKSNQDVGNADVRLYELAGAWSRRGGDLVERSRLGVIQDAPDAEPALRSLRGMIEELVESLRGPGALTVSPADEPNFQAAARVTVAGRDAGVFGLLDQKALDLFDLQTPVAAADLDVELLLSAYPPKRQVTTLPRFPGIERDLSIVVDEAVRWADVEKHVAAAQPDLLEAVQFITVYRGKPIPKGRKSLSFRMLFRDPSRTLRHDQVDPQVAAVVGRLQGELKAELRG